MMIWKGINACCRLDVIVKPRDFKNTLAILPWGLPGASLRYRQTGIGVPWP
jgi:hypothetical protein